jgi:hypothetical protein
MASEQFEKTFVAWCFRNGDGHVYTARLKAYRFTNKPMMMSYIYVDLEKQVVFRTRRLLHADGQMLALDFLGMSFA